MRITESKLRSLIRNVIKETFDHVGKFAKRYMMPKRGISSRDLKNLCPSRECKVISVGNVNSYDSYRPFEDDHGFFKDAFLNCVNKIDIGEGNEEAKRIVSSSGFVSSIMPLKVFYDSNDGDRLVYCTKGTFNTSEGEGNVWFSLPRDTQKFERRCNNEFGQINSSGVEYESMIHSREREEQRLRRDRLDREFGRGVYANPYSGETEAETRARLRRDDAKRDHLRKIRKEML